jgi:pimeloyl-ACP methyl ester carboxylesterase
MTGTGTLRRIEPVRVTGIGRQSVAARWLLAGALACAAAAGSALLFAGQASSSPLLQPSKRASSADALLPGWLRFASPPTTSARATGTGLVVAPVRPVGSIGAAATPCGESGVLCSDVVVPLDRSGATPGTITLKVETVPALGPERGVVFLIAGGPGQGSAGSFGLAQQSNVDYYRFLFPGYTLVAFDNRGTGKSGLLDCPGLQGFYPLEQESARVAACAELVGANRVHYATRDHAEDLDAVRQSLGRERVALWGTSYGTKLAAAYALAHPANVDRLILDSVVPPDLGDPFRTNTLRAIPGALSEFCGGGLCRSTTSNIARDVSLLANRLQAKPVSGRVLREDGSRRTVKASGLELLSVVVDADLDPGIAASLPAVVRAALRGDVQPLLRLVDVDQRSLESAEELSAGLFAATVCGDGPFPWTPDTPVAARKQILAGAIASLPDDAFGPFGKWAAGIGNAQFCSSWPPPAGGAALGPGPLPDVPVLAVNGGIDMRTPTSSAQSMVARFPQGRLVVVPGVGHSVLGADPSFCAARAVRSWMLGEAFSAQCARPRPLLAPIGPYPRADGEKRAGAPATLSIAAATVRDAEALWLTTSGSPGGRRAGLYGGRLVVTADGFRLDRYSIVPGVQLSGTVDVTGLGPPFAFEGVVTVGGKRAASGLLGLVGGGLAGTLDGTLAGR